MAYKSTWILVAYLLVLWGMIPAAGRNDASIKNAVVRIEVVSQEPNYADPWKMNSPWNKSGSGCIISGNRILTSAHIVANQMYIKVQKAGDVEKYTAEVEYVAHDCDLALLAVKDREFFMGVAPILMGGLPKEGDAVKVYGFPTGGSKISVTQGVVSRIEVGIYSHSRSRLLNIQVDASINYGNSGGPVLMDERMVGVAFQVQTDSENIGYIIPVPVIERFLRDIGDGRYDGVPTLGVQCQFLESPAMRVYLKMKKNQTGVYVRRVDFNSTAWGVLREGDVLLSMDGTPVFNDGSVGFGEDERIVFTYLLNRFQPGDEVPVTLLRDGVKLRRNLKLLSGSRLVPFSIYDAKPEFFIYAGLVFQPLTHNYLQLWGVDKAPTDLAFFYKYGKSRADYSQVVLLNKVLAHDVNHGFQDMADEIVTRVNGRPISRLVDVVAALAAPLDGFHVVEFLKGHKIVINAKAAEESNKEILAKYDIPKDRSDDLKESIEQGARP